MTKILDVLYWHIDVASMYLAENNIHYFVDTWKGENEGYYSSIMPTLFVNKLKRIEYIGCGKNYNQN
jgi:hypothetical protein